MKAISQSKLLIGYHDSGMLVNGGSITHFSISQKRNQQLKSEKIFPFDITLKYETIKERNDDYKKLMDIITNRSKSHYLLVSTACKLDIVEHTTYETNEYPLTPSEIVLNNKFLKLKITKNLITVLEKSKYSETKFQNDDFNFEKLMEG